MTVKIIVEIQEQEEGIGTHIMRRMVGDITPAEGAISEILMKVIDFISSPRKDNEEKISDG